MSLRKKVTRFGEPTRERIVKIVQAYPTMPLKEIADRLGIQSPGNIHYHIRRLEDQGRIKWLGTAPKRRRPEGAKRKRSRWERGDVKLPRLSAERQAELIEQVVRNAQGSGKEGEEFVGEDVVRIARGKLFRNDRMRASRIG